VKKAVPQKRGSLFLCLPLGARYDDAMQLGKNTLLISAVLLLSVSACGPADSDPGPGGVTAGDAKALDAAAKKLDERDQIAAQDNQK
jgi:hypothetical protein